MQADDAPTPQSGPVVAFYVCVREFTDNTFEIQYRAGEVGSSQLFCEPADSRNLCSKVAYLACRLAEQAMRAVMMKRLRRAGVDYRAVQDRVSEANRPYEAANPPPAKEQTKWES